MLKVPGAQIYHEVQGSGPLLLIIPGGPQDAGVFAELSGLLADRYTVAAYDPRGNSRTLVEGEAADLDMDLQGDDAAALIAALGNGPAYVFGTSGGAQIAFNLAARHAERVRAIVAHEPPAIMLLPDPSEAIAAGRDLHETYLSQGVGAAMAKFFGMNALDVGEGDAPPDFAATPEAAATFARVSGNFEYWLAHGMLPLSHYRPDVDALRAGKPRIVVAIGAESIGQPIHAMGVAAAEKLGIAPVFFPGDHIGFDGHAEAFAAALDRAFRGA